MKRHQLPPNEFGGMEQVGDMNLQIYKFFNANARLFYDSVKGAFRNIFSRMVRYYSASMCFRVIPNFMAAFSMPVKYKTSFSKFVYCLRWFKRWDPAHVSTGTGIWTSNLRCGFLLMVRFFGSLSPCSM